MLPLPRVRGDNQWRMSFKTLIKGLLVSFIGNRVVLVLVILAVSPATLYDVADGDTQSSERMMAAPRAPTWSFMEPNVTFNWSGHNARASDYLMAPVRARHRHSKPRSLWRTKRRKKTRTKFPLTTPISPVSSSPLGELPWQRTLSQNVTNLRDETKVLLLHNQTAEILGSRLGFETLVEEEHILSDVPRDDPTPQALLGSPPVRQYMGRNLDPQLDVSIQVFHEKMSPPTPVKPPSKVPSLLPAPTESQQTWGRDPLPSASTSSFPSNPRSDESTEIENWGSWTPCSVSCGKGKQMRRKSCGYRCTETVSRPCMPAPCPEVAGTPEIELSMPDIELSPEAREELEVLPSILQVYHPHLMHTKHEAPKHEGNSIDPSDACTRWQHCSSELRLRKLSHLDKLPSCPCTYPLNIVYSDSIWDDTQGSYFRWRDTSKEKEKLQVYRRGAHYCIRSKLGAQSPSLAAQMCCYDRSRRLITRGTGAGTPNLISPEVSPSMHRIADILPWQNCKGDFTRYHLLRTPNNGQLCPVNPKLGEYKRQVQHAKMF